MVGGATEGGGRLAGVKLDEAEPTGMLVLFVFSCLLSFFGASYFGRSCSCCLRAGAASALVYGPLIDMTATAAAHAAVEVLMVMIAILMT